MEVILTVANRRQFLDVHLVSWIRNGSGFVLDLITIAYKDGNNETYDVPGKLFFILYYDGEFLALVHDLNVFITSNVEYFQSVKCNHLYHEAKIVHFQKYFLGIFFVSLPLTHIIRNHQTMS